MILSHRIENEICIVSINGKLIQDKAREFRTYFTPFLEDTAFEAIVIDFKSVNHIDSTGLGVMMFLGKQLKGNQKKLALCRLNTLIDDAFKMTRLDSFFDIYPTLEKALMSFQKHSN